VSFSVRLGKVRTVAGVEKSNPPEMAAGENERATEGKKEREGETKTRQSFESVSARLNSEIQTSATEEGRERVISCGSGRRREGGGGSAC